MKTLLVWDRSIRIFHWALALIVTFNYFYTANRTLHEVLGYVASAGVAWRGMRLFKGPYYSSFSCIKEEWPRTSLPRFIFLMMRGHSWNTIGHAPAVVLTLFGIIGLVALLGISGWMMGLDRFWGEEWLEETHEILAHALAVTVSFHIFGVIRETIKHGPRLVLSMIHGRKQISQ